MLRPAIAALWSVTLGAFVLIDLSTPWVARHYTSPSDHWENALAGAMMGIVVGQVSLIGAWSTFALQRTAVRFRGALLLLVSLSFLLLVGFYWEEHHRPFPRKLNAEGIATAGGLVFVCFGTAQLPLWMAARLSGWRFVREFDVDGSRVGYKWQFRIKHVMVVTLLAAVLLAAWQWGVVEMLPKKLLSRAYIIVLYVLLMFNPMISLPWVWIAFQPRRRLLAWAIAGTVVAGIVAAAQQWILSFLFGGFIPPMTLLISLINLFQCLTVAGVLLLFRWDGWRLSAMAPRA